jgi:hypothetical protein
MGADATANRSQRIGATRQQIGFAKSSLSDETDITAGIGVDRTRGTAREVALQISEIQPIPSFPPGIMLHLSRFCHDRCSLYQRFDKARAAWRSFIYFQFTFFLDLYNLLTDLDGYLVRYPLFKQRE